MCCAVLGASWCPFPDSLQRVNVMRQQIRFLTHALARRETIKYLSIAAVRKEGLEWLKQQQLGG